MPIRNTQPGLLLLAILLLSACGSDSGFDEDTDFIVADGLVQHVNMMPDSPEVIMIHGLDQAAVGFPFAESIQARPVDKYDWRIAYLDADNDEVTVAEGEDQQVSENGLSTFLWMGSLTQPNIQIVDAPYIRPAARPVGLADVWFASNLTSYPMVDIYLTDLGAVLADVTPLATVTSGGFTSRFSVASGTGQQLRVTVAGSEELLFDSGTLEIPDQAEDFYALVDDFGPNAANHVNVIRSFGLEGTTIQDESQAGSVRAGNYSEQPSITVSLGTTIYPDIDKLTRSGSQETQNGIVDFTVTDPVGAILEESPTTISRGTFQSTYTFENNTTDATLTTRSLITADSFRLIRDRVWFKFINGSNESVDLYVLRPGQDIDEVPPFLDNVGFAATVDRESIATTIEYVVRNADNTETLARASNDNVEGISYTLVYDTEGVLHILTD